jgi:hypothetical protein
VYHPCRTKNSRLLHPLDVHHHPIQPEYALLQRARVLRNLAGLGGSLATRFALDHNVKVDELVREGGHVVLEAEGVLADGVRRQDVVALSLALAVQQHLLVRVLDVKVNVEAAAGLDLCIEMSSEIGRSSRLGDGCFSGS